MRNSFLIILLLTFSCVKATKTPAPQSQDVPAPQEIIPPIATPSPPVTSPGIDPLLQYSWHLTNTGQKSFSQNSGEPGNDINLASARNQGMTGLGVRIAISDTGVETAHEDLFANLLSSEHRDYTQSSAPFNGDPNTTGTGGDHGTSVTGIIGAQHANSVGSQGIAYNSKMAVFKYLAGTNTLSRMIDQADGNFDIFNFSYGLYSCIFSSSPSSYIQQLKYGVENLRGGKGAIYVKAAGNEFIGTTTDCFPEEENPSLYYGNANLELEHSYPYQIVVAAINAKGISSSYSTPGSSLWISAPGGEFGSSDPAIITTDKMGCSSGYSKTSATKNNFDQGSSLNQSCNYTSGFNGSSAATPMVSGSIALILEANPNLSWRDVKHILASTAKKTDPTRGATGHPNAVNLDGHTYQLGWSTNAAGYHFHNWYGFGAIDVGAAVSMAATYTNNWDIMEETNFANSSGTISLAIPDDSEVGVTHSLNVTQDYDIEAVQIRLSVEHSYIGDLGVELTSPSGTKSILMNINSGITGSEIQDELLLSNAFYGESSQGTWTIKLIDGYAQDTGSLTNWKINIIGHQ